MLINVIYVTQTLCSNPTPNDIRNWCRVVSDVYVGIVQGLSEFVILIFLYLTNMFLITTNGAQLSGISGEVTEGEGHALVPRDDQWLELSICYHMCNSHFCMLLLLSCTITISLPHCKFLHKLVAIASKISKIQQQTSK